MTNPVAKIENFSKEELTCRCGCGMFNYEDSFLIRLQAFRYLHRRVLKVTSGGRCKKNNENAGGVITSLHQCETKKASAVDVTGDTCYNIFTDATLSGLFNEVEWHKTDGKNFVHLGYDPNQKGTSYKTI